MLDPSDWSAFRAQSHRVLDDALDYLERIRDEPAWREVPDDVKTRLRAPMPQEPAGFEGAYREFSEAIFPYNGANVHPRFFGWVQGTGSASGAIAELLAATMNANVGGRNHGAVYVERQVIDWFKTLFGFPPTAGGITVTGTSAANFIAVLVARTWALGTRVRESGLAGDALRLTAYASSDAHSSVRAAFENAGLGSAMLRALPVDERHRLPTAAAAAAIARDRAAGYRPFMLIGSAGTVDTGAIDPLDDLAELARGEGLWFHVDGAFGAMAYLAPSLRPLLLGIERADSIAFDFHKWLHVPYDAGCVLVRDGEMQRATFSSTTAYLTRTQRGLSSGSPWFADFGPDLSRGFRALKVWFAIKEHGARKLGEAIARNCAQAQYLKTLVERDPAFELVAPVGLNVVCFRYAAPGLHGEALDRFNEELTIRLQESGIAVASSTTVGGCRAIRVCVVNHRSRDEDFDVLLDALRRLAAG